MKSALKLVLKLALKAFLFIATTISASVFVILGTQIFLESLSMDPTLTAPVSYAVGVMAVIATYWLFFGRQAYKARKETRRLELEALQKMATPLPVGEISGHAWKCAVPPHSQPEELRVQAKFTSVNMKKTYLFLWLYQWMEFKAEPIFYPILTFIIVVLGLTLATATLHVLMLMGLWFLFIGIFLASIFWSSTRTKEKGEKGEIICKFHNSYFTYFIQSQFSRTESVLNYPDITEVYLNRNTYYFFVKNLCHFLPVEDLAETDRLALSELLRRKFPVKYKEIP